MDDTNDFSGYRFTAAYPTEDTESFLAGRVAAFAFLGGISPSTLYDNNKIAWPRYAATANVCAPRNSPNCKATINRDAVTSSGASTNSGTAFDFGEGGSNQRMTEAVQQARMQIGKDLGISDAQVVDRVLAAAIGAKAGVGFDWGVVNGKVEAELKAAGSAKSMEEIQAAIKKSQAIMDSHNIKNADTFVDDFKKPEMWGKMQTAGDQDSKRIDSSMNAARSAQASASASLRLSEEHRQTAETAASLESKFGINFANAFTNWLNRYYPGVIGPNRNPSDARLLELGAEFVRDSVIVRNADHTFKMVQRSEMGTIA